MILFIRFLAHLPGNDATPAVKGREFMNTLIVAITMIVVAIPGKYRSPIWNRTFLQLT